MTAAFCQPINGEAGFSQKDMDDLEENWQERGFVSADMARSVCLMANPTTSKRTREIESSNMRSKILRAATNKRKRDQERAELRNLRAQRTSVATTNTDNTTHDSDQEKQGPFIIVTLPIFSTEVAGENGYERQRMVNAPSLLRMSQPRRTLTSLSA